MANPGTLPVTLVTILLLVAPGYLAIRVFLRAAERTDTLDRTGKIVWSSAVSLASLLLLYLTSPIYFDGVESLGATLTKQFNVVTGETLFGSSLSTGVLLYGGHLTLLFVITVLLGLADRWRATDDRDRREPWRYAFDDAGAGEIEVFLEDESHIRGEFDPSAWDSSRKDLYLKQPVRIADDGVESVGQSILVRSEWITRVVFPDEDRDEELMKRSNEINSERQEMAEKAVEELEQSATDSSETDETAESETTEQRNDGSED